MNLDSNGFPQGSAQSGGAANQDSTGAVNPESIEQASQPVLQQPGSMPTISQQGVQNLPQNWQAAAQPNSQAISGQSIQAQGSVDIQPSTDLNKTIPGQTGVVYAPGGKEPVMDSATLPAKQKKGGKLLPVVLGVAVLVVGSLAAYVLLNKKADTGTGSTNNSSLVVEEMSVEVPSDWQVIETEYGFSVKAPSAWGSGFGASGSFNGLESSTVTLSAAGGSISLSSPQEDYENAVQVGTQKLLSDPTNREAFEKATTALTDATKELMSAFGIDPGSAKYDTKRIKINGREWLFVGLNMGDTQYSDSLYYWNGDHAISVQITTEDATKLQQLRGEYLFKVAASLEIQD